MKSELVGLLGRHGENVENKTNNFRGRTDEPLDEEGKKQAQELADYLVEHYNVERIVSSPLLRAMETAQVVAEAFGLEIIQEGALMSQDTGFLTGEDQEEFKDIYRFYFENPSLQIPRGESFYGLYDRVGDYFEKDLKNGKLTFYSAHSSSGVVLFDLTRGKRELEPGIDSIVEPGGLSEIHWNGKEYEVHPVLKAVKEETPK